MVPTVAFWCAKCGHRSEVDETLVGHKVRCPKCETRQILRRRGANIVLSANEHAIGVKEAEEGGQGTSQAAAVASSDSSVSIPQVTPTAKVAGDSDSSVMMPSPARPKDGETFADDTLSALVGTNNLDTPPTITRPPTGRKSTRVIRRSSEDSASRRASDPDKLDIDDSTPGFRKTENLPEDEQSISMSMSVAGTSLATIKPSTQIYSRSGNEVGVGYRLGKVIGRGGMGAVHSSDQLALGRVVAIKTLREGTVDAPAAMRFRAEAAVMALLEHPNIIPVHDLVQEASGELRLVMKKVKGQTWRELMYPTTEAAVRRSVLTKFDDHLDILLKTCDAMAFAHDRGILHLDLKPANIMVGAFGEVLLLDWGCALAFKDCGNDVIPTTAEFTGLSGTPAYMSPEMANQSAQIGPHTDIYLLGAMLYEVLVGRPPHRADTVQASLTQAMLNTPSSPKPRDGRPCPEELVELCMNTIATEVGKRPPTVAEFSSQVRSYRRHVESNRLIDQARSHLATASSDPAQADDRFRQARSACEQAVTQWPESRPAKELLARTLLAHAQHSLATGAYLAAKSQAEAAIPAWLAIGERQQAAAAQQLRTNAIDDQRAQRNRQRNMYLALVSLIVVFSVGVVTVAIIAGKMESQKSAQERESLQYDSERKRNQQALSTLQGQPLQFVPLLLAEARRQVLEQHNDEAMKDLAFAHDISSDDPGVALLEGEITAAGHRWSESSQALSRASGSADAQRLSGIVSDAGHGWTPQVEARLNGFLLDHGLAVLVDGRKASPEEMEAYARRAFDAFWPNSSRFLAFDHGAISFEPHEDVDGAMHAHDLSVLSGLPIHVLRLDGARVEDLSALRGMPLERLSLAHTLVRDLSPLKGLPLVELDLGDSYAVDLSPLADCPIHRLSLAGLQVTDLTPLAELPLEQLVLERTHADLAPLAHLRLTMLSLAGMPAVDLSVVAGLPLQQLSLRQTSLEAVDALAGMRHLRILDLSSTPVRSLDPLAHLPLEELYCAGCRDLSSLGEIASAPLRILDISGSRISDLRPLAGSHLTAIAFTEASITDGWDELHAITTLARIGQEDAKTFWLHHDRR